LTQPNPKLYELYPDLKIDLMLEERVLDLPMREADVAIRMKEPSQADLIRKRLMSVRMRLYASREYLARHDEINDITEIAKHRLICQSVNSIQVAAGATLVQHLMAYEIPNTLTVNNYFGVLQGILNNIGVGILPDYLAYPEELRQSKRISAFRDFVQEEIFAHRKKIRESTVP